VADDPEKGRVALMVVKAMPTGLWGWRPQRNIPLGRRRIGWENNSKRDLKRKDAPREAWVGLIRLRTRAGDGLL